MATTTIRFDEPNEVTKAAIKEAKSGKNPNKVYDSVDELFKDLDSDKWKNYNLQPSTRRTTRDTIELVRLGSHSELFK